MRFGYKGGIIIQEDSYKTIRKLLASTNFEELREGLELVRSEISRIGAQEAKPLFEVVSTIFYIDPWDHPELVPILDEAISLVVGFGDCVIPCLMKNLDSGDIKAQFAIANALGRIGSDAIKPLMDEYEMSDDPAVRSFILYTLGKIKSQKIVQVADIVIKAAQSDDRELRDTATRAIGKIVESIPPSDLTEELHREIFKRFSINLADLDPGIRAKSIRGLGKMAKYGHLNPEECVKLKAICYLIMGTDDNNDWDRAYIVRKEAKESLKYV